MPTNDFIPHTNPDWNLELPDGDLNSLVSKDGKNHDDGYNFDEKDDEEDEKISPFDPKSAKKAREEAKKAAEKE